MRDSREALVLLVEPLVLLQIPGQVCRVHLPADTTVTMVTDSFLAMIRLMPKVAHEGPVKGTCWKRDKHTNPSQSPKKKRREDKHKTLASCSRRFGDKTTPKTKTTSTVKQDDG